MTKKDYNLISSSIHRTLRVTEWLDNNQVKRTAKIQALKLVTTDLAANLAFQDPKFKKEVFFADCGF